MRYYYDWQDTGEIIMLPKNDPNLTEIELVSIEVSDVGDFGSTLGWQRFSHIFEPNQAGTYDLVLAAWDFGDDGFYSYFAVDSLIICDSPVTYSDINLDCKVDFYDFSTMAIDWLALCDETTTNWTRDPNNPGCLIGTDIDDSNFVDANDIGLISEDWLMNN